MIEDPTHTTERADRHWTTTNLGEAVPGVVSPLCTSYWGRPAHMTAQHVAFNVGAISKRERDRELGPEDLWMRFFHGRLAVSLEYMGLLGDRLPGTSGAAIVESLFNQAPPGMTFTPTVRRYPFVALRMGYTMATIQERLRKVCAAMDAYWRDQVVLVPQMDLDAALTALAESRERFLHATTIHVTAMFGSFQPVFDQLEALVAKAGTGDLAVLSGTGGAEMTVVGDLWRVSRGEMDLSVAIANHGFHGPGEGEISSRVWREDPAPLRRAVELYRAKPESEDPRRMDAAKERRRVEMTREVLAALPAHRRSAARLILRLARTRIPDRGRGKRAFLQATDVGRMAARRAGALWVRDGVLDDPDDAFYLTLEELLAPLPPDVGDLVARRRARRAEYQGLRFAESTWGGQPTVLEDTPKDVLSDGVLQGVGASAGIVEGPVRVVQDPAFEDVEPGEILVAATTDPSWCSIMFVSSALIVDMGGMLSHAAVVARELGIPCVVNTGDATRRLRTGDRVRVDGAAGTIEVVPDP